MKNAKYDHMYNVTMELLIRAVTFNGTFTVNQGLRLRDVIRMIKWLHKLTEGLTTTKENTKIKITFF